jgi:hypothetical protein
MRSFFFYCCIPYLNLINLYIVLVCHKNSTWYCHWGTSVRGANVFGEQVFGEQVSLGSNCHWGATVTGASVAGEQVSGEQLSQE